MKLIRMIFIFVCISFSFVACGSGGGSGGGNSSGDGSRSTSSMLEISKLYLIPASAYLDQGGGTVTTSCTFDFTSLEGDVVTLRLTASDGSDLTIPITGTSRVTSGTITGTFSVSTQYVEIYTFDIWVIDSKGNSSNKLSGAFEVAINDDGTEWTEQISGTTDQLNGVIWADNQLIAVGNNGTILTSPDGIDWTQRASGTTNDLWSIAWSGTQYLTVGEYGTILTSPHGITWTQQPSGISDANLYDISWSGSLYVAVGGEFRNPPNPSRNSTLILTSPDGTTWTKRISGLQDRHLRGVTWSGSQFIAVSVNEVYTSDAIIFYSPDGIDWTPRTIGAGTSHSLFDIVWTGNQFVSVGGVGIVYTSPDGIDWQSWNSGTTNLWGIAWSGNTYVAVGLASSVISNDGISWTRRSAAIAGSDFKDIVWANSKFVAVGSTGRIFTSP